MAIAVTSIGTASATVGNNATITVGAGGVPAGCLIYIAGHDGASAAADSTVADTAGNTYVKIDRQNLNNVANARNVICHYVKNAAALVNTNTIVFTPGAGGVNSASALYATGIDTTAPLDTAVTAKAGGSSTTPSVTSGTPGVSGELFVAALAWASGTLTDDATWAHPPDANTTQAAAMISGGDQVNAGTGTKTYAPSSSMSGIWGTIVAGFKEATATSLPAGSTFDRPNPRGYVYPIALRSHDDRRVGFLGLDTITGAPGQGVTNRDWPLPMGQRVERLFPGSLRGHLKPMQLALNGQDTILGAPGQGVPNYDWPVPIGQRDERRVPHVLRQGHVDWYKLTLIGQDKFFGLAGNVNFDWPVPMGQRPNFRHPGQLRGHTDSYKLTLIGQDQFFGLAGNPTFDWPVPVGQRPSFRHPGNLRGFIKPYQITLAGQDTIYGAPGQGVPNYDWPNPLFTPRAVNLRVFYPESFLSQIVDQDAFDNPVSTRRPLRIRVSGGLRGTYWRGRAT